MKKSILALCTMLLLVGSMSAQTGMKALKSATKNVTKYVANMSDNGEKLTKAMEMLDVAFQSDEVKTSAKAWNMKGAIYNKIANAEINASLLNAASKITHTDAAMKAYKAYSMALEVAKKNKYKKTALAGLTEVENHLNNIGITAFQNKDYATAFSNFDNGVKVYEMLKANKKKSRIDLDSVRNDHIFYTAIAAFYSDNNDAASNYFTQLIDKGVAKPLAYDALYTINVEKDATKAESYLTKGRALFPEDTGLLFKEINHYLKAGKLEKLITKLKSAIAVEPDNVSVYVTMGNVYDQLHVKETTAGNQTKAKEYFTSAMDYYNQALAKDPNNFDAIYSIGTLHYNKAANMTTKINEYANDFSPAGMKKYDNAKKEMDKTFGDALPFFEKAHGLNAKDLNTLIALKEIYARSEKLAKSEEIKKMIEAIRAEKK